MILFLGFFFVFGALCEEIYDYPPGVRFYLMKTGLDYFVEALNPLIMNTFNNLKIESMHWYEAGCDLTLSEFTMDSFSYLQTTSFEPAYYIHIDLNDMNIEASAEYLFDGLSIIEEEGPVEISCFDGSVHITLKVDENSEQPGHLRVEFDEFDVDLGTLEINLLNASQDVINTFVDVFVWIVEDDIGEAIGDNIKEILQNVVDTMLELMPTTHTFDEWTTLIYNLVPEKALHQVEGEYYGDNHFDDYDHDVAYNGDDLADFDIKNYRSIDVTGYLSPTVDDEYHIYVEYDQAIQVDISNSTHSEGDGDLELWNIGMCWPENFDMKTGSLCMGPSYEMAEIRIQYQSGCGGGWFHLYMKGSGDDDYYAIPTLWLFDNTEEPSVDEPVIIDDSNPAPGYLAIASDFRFAPTVGSLPEMVSHDLPAAPLTSNNMFQIAIDDTVFSSFIKAHVEAGALTQFFVTAETNPALGSLLTTEFWDMFIGGLAADFPDTPLGMGLTAEAEDVYAVVSADEQLDLGGEYTLEFYTLDPDTLDVAVHVFDLLVALDIDLNLEFEQGANATFLVTFVYIDLEDLEVPFSFPGTEPAADLSGLLSPLNFLLNEALVPFLNDDIRPAYALALPDGWALESVNIQFLDDIVYVHGDLYFEGLE
eukprot:gnl/Chilomastix_cuspidata/222.p2 GENE.gnl/Chilomastix_cuspidata/222~~gnl/Chilomastix_cuspidata/222.p2  ORF type:complete len:648 (-),score=335.79 gnl/Chilomastix_cuspidata/222:2327-4270(-)